MQIIPLYKYQREDGGITVSPRDPYPKSYEPMYRIVADDGKILTNGRDTTYCADVPSEEYYDWEEIDAPMEESNERGEINETV